MNKYKIVKFFVIFLCIFCLNSTDAQDLSKNICKITNDITKSSTDTQDILIGNLGGETWSSTVNDIIQCVDDNIAIVVTDFQQKIIEKNLKKASVVILILEWHSQVCRNLL